MHLSGWTVVIDLRNRARRCARVRLRRDCVFGQEGRVAWEDALTCVLGVAQAGGRASTPSLGTSPPDPLATPIIIYWAA